MSHVHAWTLDRVRNRLYCACGVVGRRLGSRIAPFLCQAELEGRKHCGAEAVHVTGSRLQSRCVEHAPGAAS